MSYDLQRGGNRIRLDIRARRPELAVAIEGVIRHVAEIGHDPSAFQLCVDGRVFRGQRCMSPTQIEIRLNGRTFVFSRLHGIRGSDDTAATGDDVRADMPGTIVACHVAEGAAVSKGDPLVTIESMKLQMTIQAPRAGTVAQLHAAANASFERGAVLVSLLPLSGEGT